MSDILIRNLNKSFGEKHILENLNLVIKENQLSCIKGPSGSGKTTLLRILAGLEKADSGEIENVPDNLAFVFQEDRLLEDFKPVSNITFVMGAKLTKEEILAHLKELGLEDSLDKPVRDFSGGMKRRLAIARAICYDADFIVMDEPFKGLDKDLKLRVMSYVKYHSKGKTVLLVSHDEDEIAFMGGEIISIPRVRVANNKSE